MDLTRYTFYNKFVVTGTYTPYGGSPVSDVEAVFSKGANPGRESGKGLTANIRSVEANWTRLVLKQSQVTVEPPVESIYNDGTYDWQIVSAEDTGAGAWRCEAFRLNSERPMGRGRR